MRVVLEYLLAFLYLAGDESTARWKDIINARYYQYDQFRQSNGTSSLERF